jgi:hypothetical protein
VTFLTRLFGAASREERAGIQLTGARAWCVTGTREAEHFLRALSACFPDGAVLYLEGTGEPHVAEYLRSVSIPADARPALGTIWPKPDTHHVALTRESMRAFAEYLETHPTGHVCSHCHVYRDSRVLLEWYDAFGDDPLFIALDVDETAVRQFAGAIRSTVSVVER